ncbi:MAG: 50S ribosomal protein L6 [Clostridia bacterium]|nr:50S ribosomal protein L6 [Clostridia bacterium]
MSRIGKLPIAVPAGVTVNLAADNSMTVKGALGTLSRKFDSNMNIDVKATEINVSRANDIKKNRALHGLTRVLINNMVVGVSKGFEKALIINGVGYKVVQSAGKVVFNVGYSHPVDIVPPEGITITIVSPTEVVVKGIDKEKVGQCAANIRAIKVPDPYHLYGIRYKDEVIIKKEGKAAGK